MGDGKRRQHGVATQVDAILLDHPPMPIPPFGRIEEVPERRMGGHRSKSAGSGDVHLRLDHSAGEEFLEPGQEFQGLLQVVSLDRADPDLRLVDGDPRHGERPSRHFRQPLPDPVWRIWEVRRADDVGIDQYLPHQTAAFSCWSLKLKGMLPVRRLLKCYQANLC